jgi:hypothetical protein
LLAAAAVMVAVLVSTVPASASPISATTTSATAPQLTSVTTSRSHLPTTGGHVRLHAKTANAKRCSLSVHPALPQRPASKPCTGNKVSWRVRVPPNDSAAVIGYRFTLRARGVHHATTTKHRTVHVAAATGPPAISSINTSRAALEFVGGPVRVTAHLARALTCKIAVTPHVAGVPRPSDCTNAKKSWTVTLPQNSSTTPASYTIAVTVIGSHHRRTTATTPVTVGAHPPPCPGQTSSATPTTTAYFNDPSTHQAVDQNEVVVAEINLICDAQLPAHGVPTTIAMAAFAYQFDQVSQALLWAHQYMHAVVHVVLDGANKFITAPDGTVTDNPAYDDLVAGLPANAVLLCGPNAGVPPPPPGGDEDEAPVFPAGTGCAGDNILHTKLLAVSAVDPAHDPAVFSNSQNFTIHAVTAALNNGLQIVGDDALYNQEAAYVARLAADVETQDPDVGSRFSSASHQYQGATLSTAFFPRNSPAAFPPNTADPSSNDAVTDSVAKLLMTVQCATPGKYAGTHAGGTAQTKVRIAMFSYANRPAVTTALENLQAAGCDLQVIYAEMSAKTLSQLQAHGIQPIHLDDTTYPFPDGSTGRVFVHDKYLLISGGLRLSGQTVTNQNLVQTGSQNFTQKGVHYNDEATVTYRQTAGATATTPVYDAFQADWDHLAAIAASIPAA